MTPLFISLICLFALAYVVLPMRRRVEQSSVVRTVSSSGREVLLAKRDSLLRQIKELEFDRSMDKINADDYARMRGELSAEAAIVIQRLDSETTASPTATAAPPETHFDLEAEVLVARTRRKRSQPSVDVGANWTCSCGRSMSRDDKFCASCGAMRPTVDAIA